MDFSLNSEQILLRDSVRQFMETEMRPVLRAYEREEKFPEAELRNSGRFVNRQRTQTTPSVQSRLH